MDSHSSNKTSYSLLERDQNDDDEAMHRIFELYAPMIDLWCRRRFNLPQHLSEDIVQSVLTKVMLSLPSFSANSFRGYLFTITRNTIYDWSKSAQARQAQATGGTTNIRNSAQIPDPFDEVQADEDAFTESEEAIVVRQAFEQMASRFSEITMEMARAVWIDGRLVKDVAEQYGKRPNAVTKAVKRLRDALAEELVGLITLRDL